MSARHSGLRRARSRAARAAAGAAPALAALVACVALSACSSGGPAAGSTTTTTGGPSSTTSTTSTSTTVAGGTGSGSTPTSVVPPAGTVVSPADVKPIVAADTSVNNRANATLSLALQDSHETCLQDLTDDLAYKGQMAAGQRSAGPAFQQIPTRDLVPRQSSYPAVFSVLTSDVASKTQTTTVLLTYVKASAGTGWRLGASSEILGPTAAGVTPPATPTDGGGFVTALDPSATDGLSTAPDAVAGIVGPAFTSESQSGQLPQGVTAQFGPQHAFDPHVNVQAATQVGTLTQTFSATPPASAPAGVAAALAEPACAFPAYRTAGGGALVEFPLFESTTLVVRSSSGITQPADRSAFTPLLPPGTYIRVTSLTEDLCVAVVPPAGSSSPIEVIGQNPATLSQTGVEGGEITT